MSSVGSYLRGLRVERGISLEEIARSTRVGHGYLEALEGDDLTALPAAVFAKGFIRAYCQTLGVPPEEALALYEGRPSVIVSTAATPAEGHRRRGIERVERSRGALLGGFVMLVVLGVALFGMTLWLQPPREYRADRSAAGPAVPPQRVPLLSPGPAETPRAAMPAPTPSVEPAPSPVAPPASPRAEPQELPRLAGVSSPYRLIARTTERTWIRVRTEDGRTSEETIPAGESREWVSNRPFVLTIGNAGGVALELNGQRLPRLGPSGAVIARLVLPSDAQ